ncbi:phage integrase SAM-like domain and Arm DNA-binding domain-containing protein, partial [Rapidithrix thailandica]
MSVQGVLFKSKTLQNGEHPIMLRYILHRKVKYVATGFHSSVKHWDSQRKCPRKKHPEYLLIDEYLNHTIAKVKKAIHKCNEEGGIFSFEDFERLVKGERETIDLFTFAEKVIQDKIDLGKIKTADTYKDALRSLRQIAGNQPKLSFQELNYVFLKKMEEQLLGKGLSMNTIGIYMRALRAIYNRAIKEELVEKKYYPFEGYKVSRLKNATPKRALKKEHIKAIEQLPLQPWSKAWEMRNLFLFSYYCRGINF